MTEQLRTASTVDQPGLAPFESLRFLLRAGEALASSLDYRTTLATLVHQAVPAIADWCAVDLLDDGGVLRRLAVAHRDPRKIQLVRDIETEYPQDPGAPDGPYARLREKRSVWVAIIPDEMLVAAARDERHLSMIRALGLRSYISVPLVIRDEGVGLFTLGTAESTRVYSEDDLDLARELARRAATAIDHARAHQDALDAAAQLQSQAVELEAQTEELRRAENFARGIVESIADPMVVYDQTWHVKFENAAALRVFAGTGGRASLLGRNLWEEFPDLRGTIFEREMLRAMEERVPTSFIEQRRGNWTDVRCYPLPAGGMAAVWRDITPQRRAEQALRYLAAASEVLGASLDYEATTNALAGLVVPELADWCSISVVEGDAIQLVAVAHRDPAKVALVRALDSRYPSQREAGTPAARVIRTGETELAPAVTDAMIDAAFDDPDYASMVKSLGFSSVVTVPLRAGDRVLGAMSLASVGAESGRHFTSHDVSLAEELGRRAALAIDHARLFREAVDARAMAEEANRAKTDFLTRMSHELRTPLNAIGGYAELLAMGIRGPVTEEQREDIARIARSQHHLLSLINDVLNYARLEAGRLVYDLRPVRLTDSLAAIEPMFAPQLRERELQFRLDPADDALTVTADADKLQQVLLNLVSNAVKFTAPGGTITVGARDDHPRLVHVLVRDTGRGIPPDKLESIFEPFVQLQRSGELVQGTGLGLSISRDLARGMGGDLRAESDGAGATFILSLRKG